MIRQDSNLTHDLDLSHSVALVFNEMLLDDDKLLKTMAGAQTILLEQLEQKHDFWLQRIVDRVRPGRVDREDRRLIEVARHAATQENLAVRDQLTGLYNRRFLDEYLPKRLAELARYPTEGENNPGLAAITVDLDYFKKINDQHGHQVGDRALQIMADVLGSLIRSEDVLARTGGDEFLIIMNTNELGKLIQHIYGETNEKDFKGVAEGSWMRQVNEALDTKLKEVFGNEVVWEPALFDNVSTYFTYGVAIRGAGVLRGLRPEQLVIECSSLLGESDNEAKMNKGLRKTNRIV